MVSFSLADDEAGDVRTMSAFGQFLFWGRASGPAPARPVRDARIDVVRGIALLVIFINHMPGNLLAQWMPHSFGFSDAADAFVLLAGVSATLAYGGMIDKSGIGTGLRRLAARLWTIYLAHVAVLLIVCGIVMLAVTGTQNPLYIEAINIQPIFGDTPAALRDALTLTYQPYYLDILPLYIALLASFPLVYLGVRRSPAVTLLASAVLWQSTVAFGVNLPNTGAAGWFFNPFAWQFIFTVGVVAGRAAQLGVKAPRLLWLDLAAAGFLAFALTIKLSSGNPFGIAALNDWIDTVQLGTDKTNLAIPRVLHVASMAWLAVRFLPAGSAMISRAAGRHLAAIGRHSLPVFCFGIVLSIIGQIVMAETAFAIGVQLLVCSTGTMLLIGLGKLLSWHQSNTPRNRAGAHAPALLSSAPQF